MKNRLIAGQRNLNGSPPFVVCTRQSFGSRRKYELRGGDLIFVALQNFRVTSTERYLTTFDIRLPPSRAHFHLLITSQSFEQTFECSIQPSKSGVETNSIFCVLCDFDLLIDSILINGRLSRCAVKQSAFVNITC